MDYTCKMCNKPMMGARYQCKNCKSPVCPQCRNISAKVRGDDCPICKRGGFEIVS